MKQQLQYVATYSLIVALTGQPTMVAAGSTGINQHDTTIQSVPNQTSPIIRSELTHAQMDIIRAGGTEAQAVNIPDEVFTWTKSTIAEHHNGKDILKGGTDNDRIN